jgi:hypothetical protein
LCLQQEKVSEKLQYNLIQERWWLMLWVTKETKKSSFAFYIPGNSKKLLGWCTLKNVPMVLCIWKRWSKRLIGDKFNPYMSEVKGTTGKGGERQRSSIYNWELYSYRLWKHDSTSGGSLMKSILK